MKILKFVVIMPIANIISSARILLSLSLLFLSPLGSMFIAVYLSCGISDMLDGYIARKTNTVSLFGAKLDSFADFVMVVVLLYILLPIINPGRDILLFIASIAFIRLISMTVVYLKFKTIAMLHTYLNKLTGLLLFAFPLLITLVPMQIAMIIVCGIALISALEELIIDITVSELNRDRKSIFIS